MSVERTLYQKDPINYWQYAQYLPMILLVGYGVFCWSPREKVITTSSVSTVEQKCITAQIDEYLRISVMLYNQQMVAEDHGQITTQIQIRQRRLVENYCIKRAQCGILGSNKKSSPLIFSAEFSSCIAQEENDEN